MGGVRLRAVPVSRGVCLRAVSVGGVQLRRVSVCG